MKKLPFLTILAILLIQCKKSDKSITPLKQYTIDQLYKNVSIQGADYNEDETKVLINTNASGIFNIAELSIADTSINPLTHSTKESFFANDYLPGTNQYIYNADQGGDENDHLFLADRKNPASKDLTPWKGSKNNFYGWSDDNKSMYITSNKRDPKVFDLYKLDTSKWKESLIYQNDAAYNVESLSHSERYLALSKSITTDKNELYIYDRTKKNLTRISNDHEANWNAQGFEKNDSILFYTTNDGNEFSYLVKYHIPSGKSEKYFEDKWDVGGMSISKNEKYHVIFINDDGKNKCLLYDHTTNQPIAFPQLSDGEILGATVSNSEKKILLTVGSSTSPSNLYSYDIASNQLKKLTNTLNPEIKETDLVKAEVIRFKSFDGKDIPCIYYKPLQASKDNKVPAILWIHGGPGGQSRIGFSNSIQYLVNHGYAVLAVNNRGSSGYGRTFYKLDNKDHGNGDLKDCIYAKKWLTTLDYIDSSAIGIYGGSYGGCMVLNALCKYPDEFKVGVDLFGVANWLRTLRSIPPYWESFKKALYDELGDPNTQDSIHLKDASGLYNYQKITKPLIVFQGMNDVRVLPVESNEIVAGLKSKGIPVEYITYPDEGHGFVKKENQITTSVKSLEFLDKYLKPKLKN